MSFLTKTLLTFLVCFFCIGPLSWGCNEDCATNGAADCTDPLCKGCYDDGFGAAICNDCCAEVNQVECQAAGCSWEYSNIAGASECRNESGVDCSGIPEVPSKSKVWLLISFSIAGLGLAGALRLKKRKAF